MGCKITIQYVLSNFAERQVEGLELIVHKGELAALGIRNKRGKLVSRMVPSRGRLYSSRIDSEENDSVSVLALETSLVIALAKKYKLESYGNSLVFSYKGHNEEYVLRGVKRLYTATLELCNKTSRTRFKEHINRIDRILTKYLKEERIS